MKKNVLFLFLLIIIVSCKSDKEKLIGSWEFVNSADNHKGVAEFEYHIFRSAIIFSKENFLFVDGGASDVFNLGQFFTDTIQKSNTNVYYGDWVLEKNDSVVTLNIKNRQQKYPLKLTVRSVDKENLRFAIHTTDKSDFNSFNDYCYKKSYTNTSFSKYEFMSSTYNLWRIPSNKKESATMIANRIKESLNFALQFFKYHQENDLEINTEYLNPLPIYFASNGIALEKNDNWSHLFFDEADAEFSYEILKKAFRAAGTVPAELREKPLSASVFKIEELLKNISE